MTNGHIGGGRVVLFRHDLGNYRFKDYYPRMVALIS